MRGCVLVDGAAKFIWKEELCGVGPVVDPEKNRPLIALLSDIRSPSTFDGWEEEAGRRKSGPQSGGQTRAPRSHCSLSCGPRMVGQNNQRQRERYQYVKKLKRKGEKKHSDPTTGTPPSLN
ncbi:unnamed protein product [Arctogadus glacialis]